MDLSFYKNLSESQKAYADKIASKARSLGIPPELAVSVAYKESGLNPSAKPGSAGEIGIMQIKPDTAKEVGFTMDQIKDPDANIDAGLKYLKKSLDLSEGDPRLAAAGYNAGINHPFFSSKDKTLPPGTVDYLKDLKGFGAFTEAPAKQSVSVQTPPTSLDSMEAQQQMDKIFENAARGRGALGGLGVGAALSGSRLVGPAVKGAAQFISKATEEGKLAADAKAGVLPETPPVPPTPPGGQPPAKPTELGTPGTYGKATGPGQATFNYARSYGLPEIEAGQALSTTKEPGGVHDLLNKRQQALIGIQQRFPTETYVENPRFGGLMTPGQGSGAGPRASYVQQPTGALQAIPTKTVIPTTPPAKGALEEVTQLFKSMIEPGSKVRTVGGTVFRYAAPPLAGLQAGSEIGSMTHELGKKEPDYTKIGLSGLGAAGALMSIYPPTMPIGIPLAIGAPMIQGMREQERRPTMPSELNPMGEYIGP